jgi:hypothetical protein
MKFCVRQRRVYGPHYFDGLLLEGGVRLVGVQGAVGRAALSLYVLLAQRDGLLDRALDHLGDDADAAGGNLGLAHGERLLDDLDRLARALGGGALGLLALVEAGDVGRLIDLVLQIEGDLPAPRPWRRSARDAP